jgi:hypothetical protein
MQYTEELFVREEGDGSRIWTIVLNLGRRVVLSVSSFDTTPDSNVATFALAMFIKSFEEELAHELIGSRAQIDEICIHVARLDQVPSDILHISNETLNLSGIVAKQSCGISRPTDFGTRIPTFVFLSQTFLQEIVFEEGHGGSLQALFGLTLIEITYQLLLGKVDEEEIRPKVVSLVRKTLS